MVSSTLNLMTSLSSLKILLPGYSFLEKTWRTAIGDVDEGLLKWRSNSSRSHVLDMRSCFQNDAAQLLKEALNPTFEQEKLIIGFEEAYYYLGVVL